MYKREDREFHDIISWATISYKVVTTINAVSFIHIQYKIININITLDTLEYFIIIQFLRAFIALNFLQSRKINKL